MIDLSSKVPIVYIDVRVFAHATEDIEKVLKAVYNTLPTELADKIVLKKTNLKGHYRNPIILLETRVKKRDAAKAVFTKLASGLSSLDKELLNNEIRQRLNKGNLFIRLDKQSAYLNELKIRSDDPIHFRIHFRKSRLEEIMEICRKFGMLP
jgi:RNA binding exosome subunit